MSTWLLDDTNPATASDLHALETISNAPKLRSAKSTLLAIRLNDIVIHNVRKWFGGADVRLDVIVVHGPPKSGPATNGDGFYRPTTFHFPGVHDGARLDIDAPGLLVYLGQPRLFLDLAILISRDEKDAADLSELIRQRVGSKEWTAASGAVLAAAVAAPQAAVIGAAVAGAITLGNLTAEIVREAAGNTIGLYRVSYLQNRDRFGLGRRPPTGSIKVQDFSFWYEIVIDRT
jgi:hypothetical protein